MKIDEPKVTQLHPANQSSGREGIYHAHYADSYGLFKIMDVHAERNQQGARNWLIHAVHGTVNVRRAPTLDDRKGGTPKTIPANGFMQMYGYHWTEITSPNQEPARIIMIERYLDTSEAKPKAWDAIDRIPMLEAPEGKLWAAREQTDLQAGMHYDYLAIGPCPQYPETYIEELPHHAHGQSDAFLYVTGGEGVCTFDQISCPVREGSFVAIPRGCLYGLMGMPWVTAVSVQWTSTPRIVPREEDFLVPLRR